MTAKNYLEYIVREIHTTIVATVDDEGLPVTAAIDMMAADEHGLYFLTAKGKGFYDRLVKRQYLALTALKGEDTMSCVAVSVRGKVRELGNERIPELFELNPYMKEIYPTEDSMQALTVFQIYEGSGEWFDLSKKPIERASFTFGGAEKRAEGYFITDACIGCGSCAAVCPQNCIMTKCTPYVIAREHCLHCGNCLTACPVGAVERRTHAVPGTAVLRRTE
ncbi:4Fe-4S binding protein [Stomatobaculum longum]|uniref:4Fe-4S binding protein n=1 Tax=Stomatobaculum longum TaxID=796942 RepID=UPI002805BC64|nr:4Fe-4S binding protein [Stomatobaculum longum]